jgi:hypothetical protein
MSACVVRENPTKKPQTAAKLGLAVVLFVAAAIFMPLGAWASQPSVQAPTGPSSGGYFTGTYTFATYIYCDSGVSFSGSYSNNLDGTHNFTFVGAPDGSLLVRIDSGGAQLISSCGSPFVTPQNTAASYTVTKGTPPPTPTPTPPPTPVPTPVPTPNHTPVPAPTTVGGTSGGGTTQQPRKQAGGVAPTATPVTTSAGAISPVASVQPSSPSGSPSPSPVPVFVGTNSKLLPPAPSPSLNLGWMLWTLPLLVAIGAIVIAFKLTPLRHYLADAYLGLKIAAGPLWFKVRVFIRHVTIGRDIPRRKGLSHVHHTGKVLAHHHTSYPALVFLVMLGGVVLAGYSTLSLADSIDQQVSLTVLGPPPTSVPVISSPLDGATVSSSIITVRGTCEIGLLVGLYRNGGPSGSVTCDGAGLFAILATVVDGTNQFMAYNIDGLGQRGPASDPVNITYVAPLAPSPTPTPSQLPIIATKTPTPTLAPASRLSSPRASTATKIAPLLITTDELYYVGVTVGQPLTISARITGGTAPYTVEWDWGDGARESMYVVTGPIQATHSYTRAGSYTLVLHAIDGQKMQAVSTAAVIVNGGPAPIAVTTPASTGLDGALAVAWPLWVVSALLVASFWLGEHYREIDRPRPVLIKPQPIG